MRFYSLPLKSALLASSVMLIPTSLSAQQQTETEAEPEQRSVEVITVVGNFIPDEKRNTSEVVSALSSEDFTRAGDTDVAIALTRVTGLSLSQGKFIFVRGLGERYSSTLLDGSVFPGVDPLRRVVALDIFPTALIDNVLVQKTFSPQLPAEFGGGVVGIRTKSVPDEFTLSIGASTSYNNVSTFETGLNYDSPNIEFLTFSGARRDIPAGLAETAIGQENIPASLSEQLPVIYSADFEENRPNGSFNASIGNSWDIGERRFGILAAVNWSAESQNRFGIRQTFTVLSDGALEPDETLSPEICEGQFSGNEGFNPEECGFRSTQNIYNLSGILSLGLEYDENNSFRLVSTALRQGTKETIIQQGVFAFDPEGVRNRVRLDFVESLVWFNQISGDHVWDIFSGSDFAEPTQVKWRFAYTRTDRDAPLRRETEFEFEEGRDRFELEPGIQGNRTSFGALDDDQIETGFDIIQPFVLGSTPIDLKFGATYFDKNRSSAFRRFNFDGFIGQTFDLRALVPEIIFGPANVDDNGGLVLRDVSDASDTFQAGLENYQAYGSIDIQASEKLRLAIGLRYEDSLQTTIFTDRITEITSQINQSGEFLLPAATITYEFADNLQLRLGYSQTLSRPDLRETSPSFFLDTERDQLIQGNPGVIELDDNNNPFIVPGTELRITEIENYDARLEWYFGIGEQASVAVFYKDFTNPIERIFGLQAEVPFRTFANQPGAQLFGIEAEIEKALDYQNWFGFSFLGNREFFFKGNISLIDSEIQIDDTGTINLTSTTRRLQGQSDILANIQWGWQDYYSGEQFTLSWNYTSDRIFEVGINGAPDVIEEPPITLNANFRMDLVEGLKLNLSVDNILGDNYILRQGNRIFERYDIGVTYAVGLSFVF